MAGIGKFLAGVVSGGLVAGVTLVVVSQLSVPRLHETALSPAVESSAAAEPVVTTPAAAEPAGLGDVQPPLTAGNGEATPDADAPVAGDPSSPVAEDPPEPRVDLAALPDTPPSPPQVDLPAQTRPESGEAAPTPAGEQAGSLAAQLPVPPAAPLADVAPEGAELPPPPPPPPPSTAVESAVLADPLPPDVPLNEVATGVPAPQTGEGVSPAQESAAQGTESDAERSPLFPLPETDPVVVMVEEPPLAEAVPSAVTTTLPQQPLPEPGLADDGPSTFASAPRRFGAGEGSLIVRALAEEADADPQAGDPTGLPEVNLNDASALSRFAAPFANPDAKPLFGILLLDMDGPSLDGSSPDRQAVAALPFPVSVVIDPLSPGAAAHAALYRAGGKEVVMLATGIPAGATPADVEQALQAHASVLPEAVAVLDASDAGFQTDRALSTQIVPILAAQGRGLLTWDRGLNAADQVARREGLPTAMIFRQIDAEGESVPVMRRYLDRAAFRAAQEGDVIVLGTIQPETIAALLEWTIEGRASTVAVAPISVLLSGQ